MPGPVRGRRQLMEATQANLEPIFLLYEGGQGSAATRAADQVAAAGTPVLSTGTGDGIRHTLWAVTDPAALAAIAADLAPRQALIADGNHRYASYLEIQASRRGAGDGPGPWDYGLALLVDGDAFPPEIGAIHRVLPGLPPGEAVERAKAGFSVRAISGGTADLPAALDALEAACQSGPAFLVAGQGQVHLLTDPDPVQLRRPCRAGRSAAWRQLSTAVLQEFLLAALWGIADDEQGVRVVHHDADRAIAQADAAPCSAARPSSATRCAPRTCTRSRHGGNGCPASPPRSPPSRGPYWCCGPGPPARPLLSRAAGPCAGQAERAVRRGHEVAVEVHRHVPGGPGDAPEGQRRQPDGCWPQRSADSHSARTAATCWAPVAALRPRDSE